MQNIAHSHVLLKAFYHCIYFCVFYILFLVVFGSLQISVDSSAVLIDVSCYSTTAAIVRYSISRSFGSPNTAHLKLARIWCNFFFCCAIEVTEKWKLEYVSSKSSKEGCLYFYFKFKIVRKHLLNGLCTSNTICFDSYYLYEKYRWIRHTSCAHKFVYNKNYDKTLFS